MKRIFMLCMVTMLVGGLAFSQAQDPGFSNTVVTGLGNTGFNNSSFDRSDPEVIFHGFTNYFTANVDLGKLIIAGEILWNIGYDGEFEAFIFEHQFNVVMQPFTGLDIGVGTDLEWEVGPRPTDGPDYSAYDVPYYAGLNQTVGGGGFVQNYFADRSVAVRYTFEDIIQVGFALHDGASQDSLDTGIGIKANILDLFSIGFAYNGPFKTALGNSVYLGATISAIENIPIDIWWGIIPDSAEQADDGNGTIGARVGFNSGAFYIAPEFSMTFWNQENKSLSMYIALDTYMSITNTMLVGLNASWGLGSDPNTDNDANTAGARLNINPYFIWNLNETNKLSVGAHIMPVWWQTKDFTGDKSNFYWSIPIAWKVNF